jgi:lipopolysaccharide export system protein LptA
MCRLHFVKKAYLLIIPLIGCAVAFGAQVRAQNSPSTLKDGEPISIRSEKMTAKNDENRVIFEQNVVMIKGDLQIRADRVEVFFRRTVGTSEQNTPLVLENQNAQEVYRINATGNVDLKQGTRRAKADQAVYDQGEDKVVLTGNPEAWEKDYRVTGKKMIFFLKEDRSIVEKSQLMIRDGRLEEGSGAGNREQATDK